MFKQTTSNTFIEAFRESPLGFIIGIIDYLISIIKNPKILLRNIKQQPTMASGIIIIVLMIIISLFSPILMTYDPNDVEMDDRFQPPGEKSEETGRTYWFGSDAFGRDIYSRTIDGGKVSLFIGFAVASLSVLLGAIFGSIAGYFRMSDSVLMRVMDGVMAIPSLLLAIALMMLLQPGVWTVITAIVIVDTPRMTRVARASVLSLREQVYIEAAKAVGAGYVRIIARHIIPNLIAPLIIMGTFVAAGAMLTEAYLSFLGAGVPPSTQATWGNVMAEGRGFIHKAMWVIFYPGLFLAIAVTSINLMGDGLRDMLDPKLRRRL